MTMKYIRDYYGVPAKRGVRVKYAASDGEEFEGVITGSKDAHLRVRFPNTNHSWIMHPTWHIEYLTK